MANGLYEVENKESIPGYKPGDNVHGLNVNGTVNSNAYVVTREGKVVFVTLKNKTASHALRFDVRSGELAGIRACIEGRPSLELHSSNVLGSRPPLAPDFSEAFRSIGERRLADLFARLEEPGKDYVSGEKIPVFANTPFYG